MAKGNMLLGYSRGAVGDIVFARSKGQQVARARNRNPNNPNTEAQVLQRSKFAAAQRFFQLANSQFFKFAYEDKTERESDYNAFMRHNVGISPYILREMTRKTDYPAFAPWMVTQGSLSVILSTTPAFASSKWSFDPLGLGSDAASITTISDLSSLLLARDDWREGDIITILLQTSGYGEYPTALTSGSSDVYHYTSIARVYQLIVNTADVRRIDELVTGWETANNMVIVDASGDMYNAQDAIAVAVIHSRNTSSGLKVSSQSLILNDVAGGLGARGSYNFTRSADYEGRILQSWDAASKAVLQGAKASLFNPPQVVSVNVSGTVYTSLPAALAAVAVSGSNEIGITFDTDITSLSDYVTGLITADGYTLGDHRIVNGVYRIYVNLVANTPGSVSYAGRKLVQWS